MKQKLPLLPINKEKANQKLAEQALNNSGPKKLSKAITLNTEKRIKDKFINAREEVQNFLTNKLHYNLKQVVWAFKETKIAVSFEYEYQNKKGNSYIVNSNENWNFDTNGILQKSFTGVNELNVEKS